MAATRRKATPSTAAAPGKKASAPARRRPTPVRTPSAGDRLRLELAKDTDSYGVTVLINQAARVADRLEVLDRLLSGQESTWIKLDKPRVIDTSDSIATIRVDVRIDNPVLEERQQTTVLRHLLAQIHKQRANIPGGGDDDDDVMDGL